MCRWVVELDVDSVGKRGGRREFEVVRSWSRLSGSLWSCWGWRGMKKRWGLRRWDEGSHRMYGWDCPSRIGVDVEMRN